MKILRTDFFPESRRKMSVSTSSIYHNMSPMTSGTTVGNGSMTITATVLPHDLGNEDLSSGGVIEAKCHHPQRQSTDTQSTNVDSQTASENSVDSSNNVGVKNVAEQRLLSGREETQDGLAECGSSTDNVVIKTECPEDGRKFTAHILPPCRVCGAQATGFHYGVNTCEACKGFFHRSMTKKGEYVCLKNSKCEIKPGRRNSCSYCRYQRCLAVNMSKQSIKTGRYTYEKRTKDILEIKKMKSKTVEKTPVVNKEQEKEVVEFIAKVMANKDKMVESMLKSAHRKFNPNYSEEQMEAGRAKLRCLAPHATFEEGVDNDSLVTKWINAVENTGGLKHIIAFIKATPGFEKVDMKDQIQLIKGSFCEIWIIGRHIAFNPKLHTFTSIHGIKFDLVKAIGIEFAESIAMVVLRLQKLRLNEEETFLLMLLVVFMPDRCELVAYDSVAGIYDKIILALLHVTDKPVAPVRPPAAPAPKGSRFAHINACLVELRSLSQMYHKVTKTLISTTSEIPPLFWELISLS